MTFLLVDLASWNDRWMLAGISVATVFVILVILVLVLQIFNAVATKAGKSSTPKAAATVKQAAPIASASDDDKAAVATALYLYLNNSHDEESGILTIAQGQSAWGSVLSPRL